MSISLPSREIYAVDVPEIAKFQGEFRYNFHTPDEGVSETGGIPSRALQRSAGEVDAAFIQYSNTRVPRFISFSWKLPHVVDPGNEVSEQAQRNRTFSTNAQNGSLIGDNLDKIISEDQFSSQNFIGTSFHDGEIDDKIYQFVSGSYAMMSLDNQVDGNVGTYKAAHKLSALTPKHIKPHFLFKAMSNNAKSTGLVFENTAGKKVYDNYFGRMKEVAVNVQVNSKLFHDMTSRTIVDPNSQFTMDLVNLHKYTRKLQHQAIQRSSLDLSEADFKTFVPFIDIKVRRTAHHHDARGAEIVGYIIDKEEITPDGDSRSHSPIVIDNPKNNLTADYKVKYNATYAYSIRTIAQFTIPAIDNDNGDIAMLKILVSSKPSNKVYVHTVEDLAPPSPADLNFTWDYERVNPTTAQHDPESGLPLENTGTPGSLLIHWTFPTNSQRDIKKFQVFRRRDIHHPFELIKMYDFDDSLLRFPNMEDPDPNLIEYLTNPCTFLYDDDFYVGNHNFHDAHQNKRAEGDDGNAWSSSFIYAVASIDAHGFTSNYSAQYQIRFDPFKNRLEKKLISHSGAPKPYPNLYLQADLFIDSIRVDGPNSKQVKVYFNPEYYYVTDDEGRMTPTVATKQTQGSYKLQFINTDNQKAASTNIVINDLVRATGRALAFPEVRFGARKRSQVQRPFSK